MNKEKLEQLKKELIEKSIYLVRGDIEYYDIEKHAIESDLMIEARILDIDIVAKILDKYIEEVELMENEK